MKNIKGSSSYKRTYYVPSKINTQKLDITQ